MNKSNLIWLPPVLAASIVAFALWPAKRSGQQGLLPVSAVTADTLRDRVVRSCWDFVSDPHQTCPPKEADGGGLLRSARYDYSGTPPRWQE
ncbi:MAG: hypothetical protein H7836_11740 [Magnetococcus sp. YQC-3]